MSMNDKRNDVGHTFKPRPDFTTSPCSGSDEKEEAPHGQIEGQKSLVVKFMSKVCSAQLLNREKLTLFFKSRSGHNL